MKHQTRLTKEKIKKTRSKIKQAKHVKDTTTHYILEATGLLYSMYVLLRLSHVGVNLELEFRGLQFVEEILDSPSRSVDDFVHVRFGDVVCWREEDMVTALAIFGARSGVHPDVISRCQS
jgi:hypothetical protein